MWGRWFCKKADWAWVLQGWYALVSIHKQTTIRFGLPWWNGHLNQWCSEVPQCLAHWLHLLWWLCTEVQGRWKATDMPGWDWLWSYFWALARLGSSMQHHQFWHNWRSCGGLKKLNKMQNVALIFKWSLKYTLNWIIHCIFIFRHQSVTKLLIN